MCIVTNTKINNITLLKKLENEQPSNKIYGGQVTIQPDPRISFLQALVVGLAPLFISFWIFFFLLSELSNPNISDFIAIFYVFLMVSLILGSAPSKGDLYQITSAFSYDIRYTFYQIFLVVISIFSVWIIITAQQIPIIHEIVNYIFILIGYYVLKYLIKGVNRVINGIFKKNKLSGYCPIKRRGLERIFPHKKTKEKEAQW